MEPFRELFVPVAVGDEAGEVVALAELLQLSDKAVRNAAATEKDL